MHRNLMIFLVATACIFSGLAVNSDSSGKGFLLVMLPVAAAASAAFVLTNRFYSLRWLIGVAGFLLLSVVNHSRPGSIILVLNTLILFEALRFAKGSLQPSLTDLTLLQLIVIILLALAVVDYLTGRALGMWYGGDPVLGVTRLRLFFSEPSYLGLFGVGLIFMLRRLDLRLLLLIPVALSQSIYALAYAGLLMFRRWPIIIAIIGLAGFAAIALTIKDELAFFSSSGLVRLAGIWLLPQMSAKEILIGAGLGAGDLKLQDLYDLVGQKGAAGFLFSSVYDLGALGLFFIYLSYVRNRFDAVHLTFLLLNLGMGSFLIPVLMALYSEPRQFPERVDEDSPLSQPTLQLGQS